MAWHDEPASPISDNWLGPCGWYREGRSHPIRGKANDVNAEAGGPSSFGDQRDKRWLNRRGARQFIQVV